MKINKIYISAFGKLKNLTLELGDGFNLIYGENENGKTTIMNFIKIMFYGSGKKTQSISSNIRLKYTPWSGDTMGGRIYFEHKGSNFCLEKEFKKSDSTDRISLINLDTGEALPASANIGLRFFGLSQAAFERCVFVESSVFSGKDTDAEGEINSRLSNLVLSGEADISHQEVISRLEGARNKVISKSGRAGFYAKLASYLEEVGEKLNKAQSDAKRRYELNQTLNSLKKQYEKIDSEYSAAKKIVDSEADIRNADKLREYITLSDKAAELKKLLALSDGSIADNMFIGKLNFCKNKLENHKNKIAELTAEVTRINTELELSSEDKIEENKSRLASAHGKLSELKIRENDLTLKICESKGVIEAARSHAEASKNAKKRFNPALLIIGGILLAISLCLIPIARLILSQSFAIIPIISAVIGAALIVVSFVIKPEDKRLILDANSRLNSAIADNESNNSRLSDIKIRISELSEQIAVLSSAVESDAALKSSRLAEIKLKQEAIIEEQQKSIAAEADMKILIDRISPTLTTEDISQLIESLSAKAEELKDIRLRIGYIANDIGNISYEQAKDKLASENTVITADFEKAKEDFNALSEKKSELISSISAAVTELKTAFSISENPESIRKEYNEIKSRLEAQKLFCDAADTACEVLLESFAEIRKGYGSVLESKALESFASLTGGKYSNVNISKALDIRVEERSAFGTRESEFLSAGTADQAYLSLRLAISELLSTDEPMPIFLDDVLSFYDDARTKYAISFLKDYSNSCQTILFTCHDAICKSANEYEIKCIKL